MEQRSIAILMAAGKGTRMYPLTRTTPKPLIRVNGTPMIETVIDGLRGSGIRDIYVVTGYLGAQFGYLKDKYPGLCLIENGEYEIKNNISSLHAAGDTLGSADCYICEADLYISDPSIFLPAHARSCYYGRMTPGFSDDWVFTLQDGRITRVGKGGSDLYNMVGVSYFKKEDAELVRERIRAVYEKPGHEQLFWDEIVDGLLDRLSLGIYPVRDGQIAELDTVAELSALDVSYREVQA